MLKAARYLGLIGSLISFVSIGFFVFQGLIVYNVNRNLISTAIVAPFLLVALAVVAWCTWSAVRLEKHPLSSAALLGAVGLFSVLIAANYAFSSVQLDYSLIIAILGFAGGLPLLCATILAVVASLQKKVNAGKTHPPNF